MRPIVRDRGWARMRRAAPRLDGEGVKVGVRAGPSNDGVQVVDYAAFNEFGTSTIPARPFMRRTADTREGAARTFARKLAGQLIDGVIGVPQVMAQIGQWYQSQLRATIRGASGWAAPNAASTIAAKGSSKPLIDDGALVGSIDYERTRIR